MFFIVVCWTLPAWSLVDDDCRRQPGTRKLKLETNDFCSLPLRVFFDRTLSLLLLKSNHPMLIISDDSFMLHLIYFSFIGSIIALFRKNQLLLEARKAADLSLSSLFISSIEFYHIMHTKQERQQQIYSYHNFSFRQLSYHMHE